MPTVKEGKYLFGVCKISEKGQIVIPKEARKVFDIKPGDSLVLLGDISQGLALMKADVFYAKAAAYDVVKDTLEEKKK